MAWTAATCSFFRGIFPNIFQDRRYYRMGIVTAALGAYRAGKAIG
jgi:hypothetical protein